MRFAEVMMGIRGSFMTKPYLLFNVAATAGISAYWDDDVLLRLQGLLKCKVMAQQ